MFSNLRPSAPIYVLHKSEPKVQIGEIVSVGSAYPQYTATYQAGLLQPQKMVVDLKVKVGSETIDLQKMPADMTIADFGTDGMVVSESRDAILNEVVALQKSSQSMLDSMEHHKQVVTKCHQLIEELNPQAKVEAEQRRDIESLKTQMANIEGMLSQLLGTNKK